MGVRVRCRNESPIITVGVKNVAVTKKSRPSAFTRQGDADGIFWFWGSCSPSFYHKAGQSMRSIIWKLCNVFVRQSGKNDLMRGGRIDGCSVTSPHIHRSLSVTSWPNMRRLSFHSLRTLQILHQLTFLCFQSSNQHWKAAILSLMRRLRQIR